MKGYVFLVLFCAHQSNAFDDFFVGNYEGYDIPPPTNLETRAASTQFFSQVLDHYDPTNTARWSQVRRNCLLSVIYIFYLLIDHYDEWIGN